MKSCESALRLVVAGALAAGATSSQPGPAAALEHEIKAVFLYNIAKYVAWPAGSPLAEPNTPIVLAVLGRDPFGAALDEAVRDRTAQGRPLVIRRHSRPEQLKSCHIVFISTSEVSRAGQILNAAAEAGVLTVSESDEIARRGVIIHFIMEENKVRFEINLDAARRARVRISSELLKLAKTVKGSPG